MNDQALKLAWGHININVSNLERSIAFYQHLGFQVFIPAIPYLGLTTQAEPVTLKSPVPAPLVLRRILVDAHVLWSWMMAFLNWISLNLTRKSQRVHWRMLISG